MASSSNFALLLLLLSFSLLAASAAARPCKTLFFITTTTTSTSYYPHFPNPNPTRFHTLFISTAGDLTRFGPGLGLGLSRPSIFFRRSDPVFFDREGAVEQDEEEPENRSSMMMPVEVYSSVTSSIRDRTKDIMRVVGSLLFGVGCGALTAATMYLIWSLFWPNRIGFADDSDDDFDLTAKKSGYFAIPNKVVDNDLKKPNTAPAPAKEVV